MRISKGKKELARIISENGGWRDEAESAAQCKSDNAVSFYRDAPDRDGDCWWGEHLDGRNISQEKLIANWHQTVLSREEYFHLYPAPDADVGSLSAALDLVTDENKHEHVDGKPTIEQLAADYRNAKDYAERKQQEADAAKADADAKLKALELAAEAIGFSLAPIAEKHEPALVITDLLDLLVGDRIWIGDSGSKLNCPEGEYEIVEIDNEDQDQRVGVEWDGGICWPQMRKRNWKFINRP